MLTNLRKLVVLGILLYILQVFELVLIWAILLKME